MAALRLLVQATPRCGAHRLAASQLRRAIPPSPVALQNAHRSSGRALHTASGQKGWNHEEGGSWSTHAWAGMAAFGGSLALFTSGKIAHAAEQMHTHVYERETGIEYPRSIDAPPFVPSRSAPHFLSRCALLQRRYSTTYAHAVYQYWVLRPTQVGRSDSSQGFEILSSLFLMTWSFQVEGCASRLRL